MEAQIDVSASAARGRPLGVAALGDERLARLVGGGSERAFAALYERYHQPLYRYCRSMTQNDADAQDTLQSAFAGALVALRRGQRDAPLRPWLYRIAHNEAISLLRRRRPEDELSELSEPSTASAEHVAEERARLALLLEDLRELPERQRGALVMRELSGLSHEEVALALGISVGAAKQTVFEARRSLTEFSEGRAMDCDDVCRTVSDGDGRALRSRRVRAHLRECSGCAAFAAAIPARAADLRVLAPPLPAVAAVGLLARVATVGSGHGSGGAAGAVAATAGKSVGMALTAKAVAGVAIVATAAAGVAGVLHHSKHSGRAPSPAGAVRAGSHGSSAGPALGSSGSLAGGHRVRVGTTGSGSTHRVAATGSRPLPAAQLRRRSSEGHSVSATGGAPSRSVSHGTGRPTASSGAGRARGLGRRKAVVPGARGRGRTRPKELHAAQGSHSNHGKAPAGNGQRAKQNHAQAGNDVRPKPSDLHAAKGVAGVAAPA